MAPRSWWQVCCACFAPRDAVLAALVAAVEQQAAAQAQQTALLIQLLARLPLDDSVTVLSDAQYEKRARKFLSAELLCRCGLEVVAGVDVTRAGLEGLQ